MASTPSHAGAYECNLCQAFFGDGDALIDLTSCNHRFCLACVAVLCERPGSLHLECAVCSSTDSEGNDKEMGNQCSSCFPTPSCEAGDTLKRVANVYSIICNKCTFAYESNDSNRCPLCFNTHKPLAHDDLLHEDAKDIDGTVQNFMLLRFQDKESGEKKRVSRCQLCRKWCKLNDVVPFPICEDTMCKDCATEYITAQVMDEKSSPVIKCPGCASIKFESEELESLPQLICDLQINWSQELYDAYSNKITKFEADALKQRLCPKCKYGTLNVKADHQIAMCSTCPSSFCQDCGLNWQPQHEDISCEQFKDWLKLSDPVEAEKQLKNYLSKTSVVACPFCNGLHELVAVNCGRFTCKHCGRKFAKSQLLKTKVRPTAKPN